MESSFGQVLKRGCGEEGWDCVSVFPAGETRQVCASRSGQKEWTFRTSQGCANWRMRISRRSGRLGDKLFISRGSVGQLWLRLTFSFRAHRLLHARAAQRGCVLPGTVLRGTQRAGWRGRGGRGARSGARVSLRTWHLPHGESAGCRAERRHRPLTRSGPRLSTLPRAGRAAERVGGQAREGKGEEGGREGGRGRSASPRRGRALARAAGIARHRCGNVRHVGHGAGSGSGGRAADLVCGSGRGRRGAVFGRGGRPCCGRGQ